MDRILLVEDSSVIRHIVLGQLEKLGYQADAVGSGREALDALGTTSYGLILMDCHMADMDGYATVAELRRRESGRRRTPVIAMTANDSEGDRDKCLASGMDDYIAKPTKLEALRELIEAWGEPVDPRLVKELQDLMSGQTSCSFERFIADFIGSTAHNARGLRAAREARDPAAAELCAHNLKGSAGNVGARRLTLMCRDVETAARQGRLDALDRLVDLIASELARVHRALEPLGVPSAITAAR